FIYLYIYNTYYLFFYILIILKCKTIFYVTCHLSGDFFSLMWTLYGASKGLFY
ncbi:unnamed protein product, partial [Brassica oleracea]